MVRIEHGDYAATVSQIGAGLRSLTFRGRHLVFDRSGAIPSPRFAGLVLAPWPNRLRDGRYAFGGEIHQLPVNEHDRNTALHGLVLWDEWATSACDEESLHLTHTVWPRPGYPFTLHLAAEFRVGDLGLDIHVSATNAGSSPAPVGLSLHPYFTAGETSEVDEWSLELPCSEVLSVDERLLPTGVLSVQDAGLDFRTTRSLAGCSLDHCFTGVDWTEAGTASARLSGRYGDVHVTWSQASPFVQVYTLATAERELHRKAVAIEPMTCAPDAFNTGEGLTILGGDETLAMSVRIGAGPG